MRFPVLGAALVVAGAFAPVLAGSLFGCVIQPGTGTDAGADVVTPSTCDNIAAGYTCDQCQQCGSAASCGAQLTTCQNDPYCVGISQCFDDCDFNAPGDITCKQTCCSTYPDGIGNYSAAAQCVFGYVCPQTCASKAQLNACQLM